MELYRKVRLACRDGMSERAAARHFGVSRQSVRKMLQFSVPPGYRRTAPVRRPKLDEFTGLIEQWLEDDRRHGYGFGVYEDRYTAIPPSRNSGSASPAPIVSSGSGWRLAERVSSGLASEFGLEGTRREFTGVEAGAEHGLVAGAGWRLIGRGAESFEVRVEAELREAANGDVGSEHSVGLRLGASW